MGPVGCHDFAGRSFRIPMNGVTDVTALSEESQDRRQAMTDDRDPEVEAETRAAERVITFDDAVIAIAITLLALDLPVPGGTGNPTNGQLLHALREGWPDYLAFLISFLVIGNQWMTHRRVFRYVGRLTGWVGRLNMLWLLMMVLTPPATRMLAGSGALGVRFAVYTLIQVIATACLMQMSRQAKRGRMLRPDAPESAHRSDSIPYLAVIITFLVSIPVAFATEWAFALWIAVPLTARALRLLMARAARNG
jgi:uncharacterized membrane protein